MKVYVDELPKGCESCPFYLKEHCVIDNISFYCPLEEGTIKVQSLADYTKQVRKEDCEEIGRKITMIAKRQPNHNIGFDCEDIQMSYLEVASILDQMQD